MVSPFWNARVPLWCERSHSRIVGWRIFSLYERQPARVLGETLAYRGNLTQREAKLSESVSGVILGAGSKHNLPLAIREN